MRKAGIAAMVGLATVGLAAAGLAWGSECAEDNYEVLTLELDDVTIDGAPADDLSAWDKPVELGLQWDGSLVLDVDGQTTVFDAVQP